jgi:hypothetical protein
VTKNEHEAFIAAAKTTLIGPKKNHSEYWRKLHQKEGNESLRLRQENQGLKKF